MNKRTYSAARAVARDGGFGIALDERPLRSPRGKDLVLPSLALAAAVAAEWEAQEGEVRPRTMPLTRLANTGLDRVATRRAEVVAEIAAFAACDLVCYRAEEPAELARRQEAAWRPLLDWLAGRYGAELEVAAGVVPHRQPKAAVEAIRAALAAFDDMMLAALHAATTGCGSVVIALALAEGRITADEAFALSRIDETFQAERWGHDAEAARRAESLRRDIASAARFMELCRRAGADEMAAGPAP